MDANKIEIKNAIEEIFGVEVDKVTTAIVPGKKAHGRILVIPPMEESGG